MNVYIPALGNDASADEINVEISLLTGLLQSLRPDSPNYSHEYQHYCAHINDLQYRLQAHPSANLQVASRKRSLGSMGDYHSPDSKRPSPAMTPAPDWAQPSPWQRNGPTLAPITPNGYGYRSSYNSYSGYNSNLGTGRYESSNYIDLTADDDSDQFPELQHAYQNNTRPTPAPAHGHVYLTDDEMAQLFSEMNGLSAFDAQPMLNTGSNSYYGYPGSNYHHGVPVPRVSSPVSQESEEAVKKLIENIKAHDDLPREQTPRQMGPTQLKEHQKIGLSWLIKMEESTKGGILADEMGLGKTVQALALMLARPSRDEACKTTLIIAPVALMRQWEKEIARHVRPEHRLKVYVYHSSGKNADFDRLRKYDVVLTTYGTLASEFKQKENRKESELALREQNDSLFTRKLKDELALVGRKSMWYRIILDEAQCIKNKGTLVSRASSDLQAKYRLCMTGTPMMNSIDELYPLLRFLKVEGYKEWRKFSADISKPLKNNKEWSRDKGLQRVQALLKSIMLRREKTSLVDGEPVCKIPPKHTRPDHVTFSDAESELYKAIETHSQLKLNKYLQKGTVNNNYANVLVLLLRLRQACCHPHLINDLGVQVSTEGIDEAELLDRAKDLSEDVVARLKDTEGAFECPICFEAEPNPTVVIPCGHTLCGECFQKLVDPSMNEDGNSAKCPHCRGSLRSSMITDYRHFCKAFFPDESPLSSEESKAEEEATQEDSVTDSDSDSDEAESDDDLKDFVVPDDADDKYVAPTRGKKKATSSKKKVDKGKGKAPARSKVTLAQLKKDSLKSKAAKKKYLSRLSKKFEPSAKIERTVELLTEIRDNDPTEKTLIFSQFTSLLDLLEIPLRKKKFKYQRYDGSMRMNDRVDAVDKFMEEATENIILISLKAGNSGLNLSKASRVIMMDPFWNPYIEEQAVDRAHRMPQTREVIVHRMLVPETVEDRICKLQEKKREFISAALDEGAGKSLTRLNIQELRFLFGL
ncbi:hypothetical protein BS50DRAFT_569313 [Corynespora cassiicola Philippines]|uniref:SWI/SNF family DNA-dependent ATPase Ris1 n=1 Tax=Corynespora cassiicola Philippines TaxID=1448308 RepID=A0A2T2P1Y1_CORCC|nr:hypothetical protein BS50DRAFT_569313 [Corynespora cassiicola Philippines]